MYSNPSDHCKLHSTRSILSCSSSALLILRAILADTCSPFQISMHISCCFCIQYNDMWTRSLQSLSFNVVIIHWVLHDDLITCEEAGMAMGSEACFADCCRTSIDHVHVHQSSKGSVARSSLESRTTSILSSRSLMNWLVSYLGHFCFNPDKVKVSNRPVCVLTLLSTLTSGCLSRFPSFAKKFTLVSACLT